eukprot:TRINITY_DN15339_c0_g1_i1.p1 TRINITY_DN15339_c0_g1~~TRINITY_DN15339_c0_g1_i1.p1  ORF type:complete len:248 (+),score=23.53 TRINITY_DN15339_c0_g1_i1:62-745(+)
MDALGAGSYSHFSHGAEHHYPWMSSDEESRVRYSCTPVYQEAWEDQSVRNHQSYTSMIRAPEQPSVAETIQERMTTLVLTDLPYTLTLADLRDEMSFLGFAHSYDYIFYPSQKKDHFRGYCFVNFVNSEEARRFAKVFVNHKFEFVPSAKLSNVQLARTQGLQENLMKLKPGAARSDNCFIDMARLQDIREGYARRGSGGWYHNNAGASWNYPESDVVEPSYSVYYQ